MAAAYPHRLLRAWALAVGALILALGGPAAAAGPAVAGTSPAGAYRLHQGPDMASELIVKPDGTFDYFLAAGSLDEMAHGTWRAEGKSLRLTTIPKPVPAVFTAGAIATVPEEKMVIHVTAPSGGGIAAVDFTIGFDAGEPVTGYTQDYGWSLASDELRTPRWISFSLAIYGITSQRFPIDLAKGNSQTFILNPNDLGTIDFTDLQIDIEPRKLVVHRWGSELNYTAE